MLSATVHNAPNHVPAWKRLGLKLKSEASSESPSETLNPIELSKRKIEVAPEEGPAKKITKTSQTSSAAVQLTPVLSRKKSVTFTPETKIDDGDSIKQLFNSWVAEQKSQDPSFQLQNCQPAFRTPDSSRVAEQVDTTLDEKESRSKRTKKRKPEKNNEPKSRKSSKASKITKFTTPSPRPYLQYLRQYHQSKDTWKFNKNHQSHILKHAFDIDTIPSDHAHLICPYVRGLQGGVRTRLRDAALAIKVKDQEEGIAGFPDDMAEADKKQREYDAAMKEYVATMTAANVSSKIGYEEGLLLGLSDAAIAKRVAKRIRAEQILAELGTSQADEDRSNIVDKDTINGDDDSQKRVRMNDGSSQKVARKRKQRTMTVEHGTSSSDSNNSDDDSSDESLEENHGVDDTSSSSSSSSGSDSEEEDSEDDSDDSSDDSGDDDDE